MRTLLVLGTVTALCVLLGLVAGCGGAGVTNPDDTDPTETDLSSVVAQAGTVTTAQLAAGTAGVNVTVTDASAFPLAGVVVYLTPAVMDGGLNTYPQAIANAQGQVGFRNVPINSNLRIRVTLPNRGGVAQPVGTPAAGQLTALTVADS